MTSFVLLKFGCKKHLQALRQSGAMRWSCPEAHEGEPLRSEPGAVVRFGRGEPEHVAGAGLIYSMTGIDAQDMGPGKWLERLRPLAACMRKRQQDWFVLVLDTTAFIQSVEAGIMGAPRTVERRENVLIASMTNAPLILEANLVRYVDSPSSLFEKPKHYRDEREFRFLAYPRPPFTWDGVRMDWRHECLDDITPLTYGPCPLDMLITWDWWQRRQPDLKPLYVPHGQDAPWPPDFSILRWIEEYRKLPPTARQPIAQRQKCPDGVRKET